MKPVADYYSVQEGYAADGWKVIYGRVLDEQAKALNRNDAEVMLKRHAARCKEFYSQKNGVKCVRVRLVRVNVREIKEVDV